MKILEVLTNFQNREPIDAFWNFLLRFFPDLYEELQIEISAEKEELFLDEKIKNESRYQVQRTFGGSKHFSEREKNKLEHFLCTRMQILNDIWSRKADRIKSALRKAEALLEECDRTVGCIVLDLEERVETQKRRMLKFLPEEKQRRIKSMIMRHNREYPSRRQVAWKKLEISLAKEEVLFDYCLTCSEEITKERMKVLKLLNLEGNWLRTEVDKELKNLMNNFYEDTRSLKKTMTEDKKTLRIREEEMARMVYEHSKQIGEKEQTVQNLKAVNRKMQQISIKLENELKETRAEIMEMRNELNRWKIKCQAMEISRHKLAHYSDDTNAGDDRELNANQTSGDKFRQFTREPKSKSSTLPKLSRADSWMKK